MYEGGYEKAYKYIPECLDEIERLRAALEKQHECSEAEKLWGEQLAGVCAAADKMRMALEEIVSTIARFNWGTDPDGVCGMVDDIARRALEEEMK